MLIMSRYQLFYKTTVELLKLKSPLNVKHLLSTHQEFASWFKLQSIETSESCDLKQLHSDLSQFFKNVHPHLRFATII